MTSIKTLFATALAVAILNSGAAMAEIPIGIAASMTGSEANYGEQYMRGATKAIADINAKGGVLGQKLKMVVGDDACDPRQAVSVANDMVSDNVAVVIGHYCSGSSIPASDVYSEAGIIQISPGSTNPQLTERGIDSVFRICGRDDKQGPTAAEYLTRKYPGKRIALVNDKSTAGKGLADAFEATLKTKGITPVLNESITAGERDYSPLVTKLKQAKADFLYFGGYKTEAGLIVRQMRAQGLKTILVSGDALVTEEYWAITGPAGEGTLMTFGPDPRLRPENAALVKAFRDAKYEPEAYTLYTYAAIQAWVQAVTAAKTTKFEKVRDLLHKQTFNTVMGPLKFDAKGDNAAPGYVFYEWKNGKYEYVKN